MWFGRTEYFRYIWFDWTIFIPALNIVNDYYHYESVVELEYSTSPSYDIWEVGGTIVAD